ncbi:MAG TPA: hypothetical protein VMZ91_05550 [Candidatus Paceibacterota bacterium]|nr:hypothetical protein [Candidatus Paceibacterota bacterium]
MENQKVEKEEMKVKKVTSKKNSNQLTEVEKIILRVQIENRIKYIQNNLIPIFKSDSKLDKYFQLSYEKDIEQLMKISIKLS